MSIDVQDNAVLQKAEILQELANLAVAERQPDAARIYRAKADHLLQQFAKAEIVIAVLTPKPTFPYASFEKATEAVIAYLKDVGRPSTEEEIIKGVIEGGWRAGKHGSGLRVKKGIDMHLKASRREIHNPGKMADKIKEIGGLIGLYGWDEGRFKPLR